MLYGEPSFKKNKGKKVAEKLIKKYFGNNYDIKDLEYLRRDLHTVYREEDFQKQYDVSKYDVLDVIEEKMDNEGAESQEVE